MSMSWIKDISNHHMKKFSQYGEEGYLKFILKHIGTTNKFLVDLGANDGRYLSNTKIFRDEGWDSVLIEGKEFPGIHCHYITGDNVCELLEKYGTPNEFDLLSIDLDGQDYWILRKLLTKFKPRLIISEYNSEFTDSRTIEYNLDFYFKATDYYGYTFDAGLKLAKEFGYRVIFQNANLNMYYLRQDLLEDPEMEINVPHPHHVWWGHGAGLNDTKSGKWVMI
jgi:hypothetical protein